jgi:outer membrane protein assembly factor BamD (BamD/ComL family)
VSVDGFSQKDIPTLLQLAQSALGAGNYDKARREYGLVARLQPGNQDAKQGLHKLDIIQGQNR